ncbi:MAG: beta-galactosidase [bacterium]
MKMKLVPILTILTISVIIYTVPIFAEIKEPLNIRTLNPAFDFFPNSSLQDFSYLLDAPAGKHGFLTVRMDGHFYFTDGTRGRFWGVTIPDRHIDIPHDRIDTIVDTLARAGVNLVRLQALDKRFADTGSGIQRSIFDESYPNSTTTRYLDRDYRDRVNYWIYKLKQRGIYIYLDLCTYRMFKDGDGVTNAAWLGQGAKPYVYFNSRLIELQKLYAEKLLCSNINPYTNVSIAQDPAVVMLNLNDENGLFSDPEKWPEMVEPYRTEFQQKWNLWLQKKYGSSFTLRSAWTNTKSKTALGSKEMPEDGSVLLPKMDLDSYSEVMDANYTDLLKFPARQSDAVRFAVDIQRQYFASMRDFLRQKGIKIPISAVVNGEIVPDIWTVTQELDFIAEPVTFDNLRSEPGKAIYTDNKNYLRDTDDSSFISQLTRIKFAGKPVVISDCSISWPNTYRAAGMLESAAYGCLQDIDAQLNSAYYCTSDLDKLTSAGIQADPTRWGLLAIAGKMFLQHDVKSAEKLVEIGYSKEDMYTYANYLSSLNKLGWIYRLQNRYVDPEYNEKPDLIITSGRSQDARYIGNHSIIYSNAPFATAMQSKPASGEGTITAQSKYRLTRTAISPMEFIFSGIGYETLIATKMDTKFGFDADEGSLAGYQPMGLDKNRKIAYGFYDPRRDNLILAESNPEGIQRFAVDLIQRWYNIPITHKTLESGIYPSDTKELTRDTKEGRLLIDTDKTQVIQGSFNPGQLYKTGKLEVSSQSPFGVIIATSLDNQPIATAKKVLVKMVTIAENRGQKLEPASSAEMAGKYLLSAAGCSPIQTWGKWSNSATEVTLNGIRLIDVYLINGTWELLCDFEKDQYYFYCDTPNTRVTLNSHADKLRLVRYRDGIESDDPEKSDRTFIYPGFAKYLELTGIAK